MRSQKVLIIRPGCDKNLVDAEVMLGALARRGYEITTDESEAEVIIVTTCSFVKAATHASICAILDSAELKHTGRCHTLIVAGCLAQRYRDELVRELPEVDLFLGTADYADIVDIMVQRERAGQQVCQVGSPNRAHSEDSPRLLSSSARHAFLKIAEGCSNRCAFCAIPQMRGRYRSRSPESLIAEAGWLVSEGVRELVLIAQDPSKYGEDLGDGSTLVMLLRRLAAIDELRWIWIQYVNPDGVGDDLIAEIRDEPKIRKFLSVQIQHISDPVLRRMNRRSTETQIRMLIKKLRREIPDLILGTVVIVGFPGETEEDHEALLRVAEEGVFDFMGVFPYSREEGTPAAAMPDQIDEAIKSRRYVELSRARAHLWPSKIETLVGTTSELIVEGYIEAPPGIRAALERVASPRDQHPGAQAAVPGRPAVSASGTDATAAQSSGPELVTLDSGNDRGHGDDRGHEHEDVYTLTAGMPADLSEHIRLERNRKKLRARVLPSFRREHSKIGANAYTSARSTAERAPQVLAGRLPFQIPGQDSKTYLVDGTAEAGDIVTVEILGVVNYDLIGTMVGR